MKQVFFHCLIRRDAVETVARLAAATEVPVLQAVYGDALAVGKQELHDRPDDQLEPGAEFERLAARYGLDAVIAAYGTRTGAEREIAGLFREGAKAAKAKPAGARQDSADPFLQQTADAITEQVAEQPDEALLAYLEAEQTAAKPRKTVLEALQAELAARAEEDANEANGQGRGR